MIIIVTSCTLWFVFNRLLSRVYHDYLQLLFDKTQHESETSFLLDSLGQSIMLVYEEQQQIELVNDQFLCQFKNQIQRFNKESEILQQLSCGGM